MHKSFLKSASLLAALTVLLGAFAAHGLKKILNDAAIAVFETGVRYQFYHTIGLFIIAILYKEFPVKMMRWAGRCMMAGIALFSGSLYLLSVTNNTVPIIGIITPFGGVLFVFAWLALFLTILKKSS